MAVAQGYGKTVTSGSVFAYDTGDTVNSYIGQPTTNNYGNNFRDFTGTGYSPDGEWISTEPTRFTKTYYPNLTTPIGPGATLIEESGTGGYHHLSRYGGESESGAHSLSCYIYPLVSGITDFCIGMLGDSSNNIRFNLDTRVITYGGGISNTNAFIRDVPGWPGWLRVGANIEGRGGGWVGCFGYSSYTSYTGTAGGKKAYITGIQYEYTTQPTSFTTGTRSATQGLLPLIGNSTIDLSNMSFDSNAQMVFDGTNDYVDTDFPATTLNTPTIEAVVYRSTATGRYEAIIQNNIASDDALYVYPDGRLGFWPCSVSSLTVPTGQWTYVAVSYNGTNLTYCVNGVTETITAICADITDWDFLRIGGHGVSDGERWIGKIVVSRVYNRALSAAEIQQNYRHYKTRFNLS